MNYDLSEDLTHPQHPTNPTVMVQQATDGTWGVWVTHSGVVKGAGSGFATRDEAYAAGADFYDGLYVRGDY